MTFALTLGAGFIMENREGLDRALSLGSPAQAGAQNLAQGSSQPGRPAMASILALAAITPTSGPDAGALPRIAADASIVMSWPAPPARRALAADVAAGDLASLVEEVVPVAFEEPDSVVPEAAGPALAGGGACALMLETRVAPAAMIEVTVAAPCSPLAPVTLHHQGMSVTILTDDDGRAHVALPALAETAVVLASMAGEPGARAVTQVPDVGLYDRAVLQWRGPAGPAIHAREFGAAYGGAGHVWSGAPGSLAEARAGRGGMLVSLGDPTVPDPRLAEVYTYPSGASARAGTIAVGVEAEVTALTCGRVVEAQTIQVSPGARPFSLDLSLTMPPCGAVGEWIVMGDLLLDLTVAER